MGPQDKPQRPAGAKDASLTGSAGRVEGIAVRLASRSAGLEIRLVAIAGWGQEDDRRRSSAAGFDRHPVKPVDGQVLADLLAGL